MTGAINARRRWLADSVAGFSVALIVVPQGLAYAELAGVPAHHGLFAAALPPLLAAFFASSPYLQTGPTAVTSLLTFGALSSMSTPGSPQYVQLAMLLAVVVGATRLGLGVLRAGSVSYLMSQPVLRGFTFAAAILILVAQFPAVLGVAPADGGVLERAWAAVSHPGQWSWIPILLAVVTLALVFGGRKLHKLFPGVLVAVVGAGVCSVWLGYAGPKVGNVPTYWFPPLSVDLPWASLPNLIVSGVVIAVVGFAEVASIAQVLAERERRPWDPNREFVSQGVANLVAGLSGGFPVGGSFSRSALNRMAGAQSRAAGAITGITILALLPLAFLVAPLPKAVLGAIVIAAVIPLLDARKLFAIYRQSRPQAVVGWATFALTLALSPDIQYAVLAGIGLAVAVHVWREQHVRVTATIHEGVLILAPEGVLWFGSAPELRHLLANQLAAHRELDEVIFDISGVGRIDLTGAMVLRDTVKTAGESGTAVRIGGVPDHAERILARVCPHIPRTELPAKPPAHSDDDAAAA